MKWFPLHKTKVLGGARDISLGQKYLTTADPFDPNYNTPDLHRDLKKLTCPNVTCVTKNKMSVFMFAAWYTPMVLSKRFHYFFYSSKPIIANFHDIAKMIFSAVWYFPTFQKRTSSMATRGDKSVVLFPQRKFSFMNVIHSVSVLKM